MSSLLREQRAEAERHWGDGTHTRTRARADRRRYGVPLATIHVAVDHDGQATYRQRGGGRAKQKLPAGEQRTLHVDGDTLVLTYDEGHVLLDGGDGHLRVSGEGPALAERTGWGDGDAYRAGSGHGDAWRTGTGTGDAVRSGSGAGDAHRYPDGPGTARHTSTGAGQTWGPGVCYP